MVKIAVGIVTAFTLIGAIYAGLNELAFADDIVRLEQTYDERMGKMLTVMQHHAAISKSLQSIMIHDAIDRAIANPNRTDEQTARLKQLIELGE